MSWTNQTDKAEKFLKEDDFSSACKPLRRARDSVKKLLPKSEEVIKSGEMMFPTGSFATISRDYAASLFQTGKTEKAEQIALDTWQEVRSYVNPAPDEDSLFADRISGIVQASELMDLIFVQPQQKETLPNGKEFNQHFKERTEINKRYSDRFSKIMESMD